MMPTTQEILAGLTSIANDAVVAAVVWHQLIAVLFLWVASGWRPRRRLAIAMLAAPMVSVAAFALAYHNPFNAVLFLGGAVALLIVAARGGNERVLGATPWATALGLASIAFAWAYPHFLHTATWITYLYAAPVGLVPCPSLALAIGFALLAGGIDRRVAYVLGAFGLFYGVIGVVRFGVVLDVGLLAGAAGLLAIAAVRPMLHRVAP
jgi:hypothetical protein